MDHDRAWRIADGIDAARRLKCQGVHRMRQAWKLKMKRHVSKAIVAMIALSSSVTAQAASFDCAKASTAEEHAVCSDPKLSALDSLLGQAFAEAKKDSDSDRQELDRVMAVARAFQKQRETCGSARPCLVASYAGALYGYGSAGSTVKIPSWIDADVISGGKAPASATLPKLPGQCVSTRVAEVHPRLGGDGPVKSTDFDAGTGVAFDNGGQQVSYSREQAIITSYPGDPVIMCLISIPQLCPPGDDRGRSYVVTNTRTKRTWTLPDSEHMCGGA